MGDLPEYKFTAISSGVDLMQVLALVHTHGVKSPVIRLDHAKGYQQRVRVGQRVFTAVAGVGGENELTVYPR